MNEKERWRKTDHARERKDERSGRKIERKKKGKVKGRQTRRGKENMEMTKIERKREK